MLKRRDAAIIKILDMAGHVVLYQFNEDSKAWDRKGVEGSLFVVERSTEPRYPGNRPTLTRRPRR